MRACIILRNDIELFGAVKVADRFMSRLVGLLKTSGLSDDQGLLLKKCNQVHTLGMKFPIDVIFLSKDGDILHIEPEMAAGKVSPHIQNAFWVLEVKSESCRRLQLEINQHLIIRQ
ncbi:MAG: DUF192 domain-containing protein [Acetobacterium sp.]|nr:DUF192 domain-containing protein [Acetobacterium sp.]